MQTIVATPQRKGRRDKRHYKTKGLSQSTDPHEGPDTAQESISAQAIFSPPQQMGEDMQSDRNLNGQGIAPTTPSRPRSMCGSLSVHQKTSDGRHSGNVSAVESDGRRNKKAQNSHKRQSGSYVINSNLSGNAQTPGRSSATPLQAYAGPTFHASPAPSSLPMPKFLSKSVPEVNKSASLAARLETEALEGTLSPGSSEGSPIQEKAERKQQHITEESPLDIFFKADREEKARARQISSKSPLLDGVGSRGTVTDATSGSPLSDRSRHHSRQLTNGSTNGLFPMEMDDEKPNSPAHHQQRPSPPANLNRATSAPSDIMTRAGRDEATKRSASSLALKKLLLTPQPQRPVPQSKNHPSSEGRKRHTPPVKESSGPFKPSQSSGPEIRILSRNQPASLPQLQKQFGSTPSVSSPRARPPSSNLRQELSAPQTPVQSDVPELPASPTPCQKGSSIAPLTPRSEHDVGSSIPLPPLPPAVSPNMSPKPVQSANNVSRMEDELRRVLKLNVLGSDGATGVRS